MIEIFWQNTHFGMQSWPVLSSIHCNSAILFLLRAGLMSCHLLNAGLLPDTWHLFFKNLEMIDQKSEAGRFKFSGIHFDITLVIHSKSSIPIIAMWPWIHRNIRLFSEFFFLFLLSFVLFSLFVYLFVLKKKRLHSIINMHYIKCRKRWKVTWNISNILWIWETLVLGGGMGWFSGCESNIVSVTT